MTLLYELTGQYIDLLQMAEEEPIYADTIKDTLEGIDGEIEDAAENYAAIIQQLKGEADMLKKEEARLADRRKVIENNANTIKTNLETMMIATGKRKFKTDHFSFGIQKNPPSLDVLNESLIPEEFWKQQKPTLDRKAALDYIKKNGEQDWGRAKQAESLRIR